MDSAISMRNILVERLFYGSVEWRGKKLETPLNQQTTENIGTGSVRADAILAF